MLTEAVAIALIGELAKNAAIEAAKAFGKKAGEYGTGVVLGWVEEYLKTSQPNLSKEDREKILKLVAEDQAIHGDPV